MKDRRLSKGAVQQRLPLGPIKTGSVLSDPTAEIVAGYRQEAGIVADPLGHRPVEQNASFFDLLVREAHIGGLLKPSGRVNGLISANALDKLLDYNMIGYNGHSIETG